jgi:hypothetical protein
VYGCLYILYPRDRLSTRSIQSLSISAKSLSIIYFFCLVEWPSPFHHCASCFECFWVEPRSSVLLY